MAGKVFMIRRRRSQMPTKRGASTGKRPAKDKASTQSLTSREVAKVFEVACGAGIRRSSLWRMS